MIAPRLLRALAPFGLDPGRVGASRVAVLRDAESVVSTLLDAVERVPEGRGILVLVTGPSGSGKSTVLERFTQRLPAVGAGGVRIDASRSPAEHRASLPLDEWLALLGRAGLADARMLATPAARLSDGERARLRLALGMAAVGQRRGERPWLVVDECCSVLDRDTAGGVCAALRRWVDRTGARVLAASAHADLERLLGPDVLVRCGPGLACSVAPGTGRVRGPSVRVEPGTMRDHDALASHHYRAGRPATPCRVLRAVVRGAGGPRLAGVLVVSHPTLNGAWRDTAWPGRYLPGAGRSAVSAARRLNREVRRISRVIVDPRDRGRGIATRLVGAYLDDPVTPATEAVAAMGRIAPFWRSAGMTEYPLPPRPADDRLADVLHARGIEPWMLLDPDRRRAALRDPFAACEIERWGRSVWSSVPKPVRVHADAAALAPLAASRLCAPPVAYAHTSN